MAAARRPRSLILGQFISAFHYHENKDEMPAALERVLPSGRVHVMINLLEDEFRTYHGERCAHVERTGGAVLAGPHSRATIIDTREQRCLVSVNFKLGGAAPFFCAPISEARDLLVGLDDVWGRDGRVLRERVLEAPTAEAKFDILEAVLLDHLVRLREPDPLISFAAAELDRGGAVSEVGALLGISPKTFLRRFEGRTGLTPKRFARLRRLQRVVRELSDGGEVDWSGVAFAHGYTDQAHFIHDFRELTGMTPTGYRPRSAEEHNHVPVSD